MPQATNPYQPPSAEAVSPPSGKAPRRTSLLLVFAIVCIDLLGFGLVLPLLPIYGEKLAAGLPKGQVGMIVGMLMLSFPLMQFLFSPLWGRLSDRLGRRPVLLMSLAGSALFYACFGLASLLQNLTWMFLSRIGAGIAAATIPTAQAYIADVTPPEKRARGMAMIGAAFGLGFTLGPLIGAAAIFLSRDQSAVSPWPGFAAAILSGTALLVAWFKLPESLRSDEIPEARRHFDLGALRDILAVPSLGLLLATSFAAVFSLANFESTLSFTIREEIQHAKPMPDWMVQMRLMLVFAYIGVIQCLVQGVLVRRLANHLKESVLATIGSLLSIGGFVMLAVLEGGARGGIGWLMAATAVEVSGIAFVFPAISSLISRRSDPAKQGGILGAGESVGSIARIAGFGAGVPLYFLHRSLPFETAAVLMAVALALILVAVRIGRDWRES